MTIKIVTKKSKKMNKNTLKLITLSSIFAMNAMLFGTKSNAQIVLPQHIQEHLDTLPPKAKEAYPKLAPTERLSVRDDKSGENTKSIYNVQPIKIGKKKSTFSVWATIRFGTGLTKFLNYDIDLKRKPKLTWAKDVEYPYETSVPYNVRSIRPDTTLTREQFLELDRKELQYGGSIRYEDWGPQDPGNN